MPALPTQRYRAARQFDRRIVAGAVLQWDQQVLAPAEAPVPRNVPSDCSTCAFDIGLADPGGDQVQLRVYRIHIAESAA